MFSNRAGAPSRRRPGRACKAGIEGLETRAVPGTLITAPHGMLPWAMARGSVVAAPLKSVTPAEPPMRGQIRMPPVL
jgi:hypothetical protein